MIYKYIIQQMNIAVARKNCVLTENKLSKIKRKAALKFHTSCPTNITILAEYQKLVHQKLIKPNQLIEKSLVTKAVRTSSGVAVVAILTKPYPCPGKCLYCPEEKGMPKSYLSNEPAVMRAILTKFHPYKQVKGRLESLLATGHPIDKIEIIVMGGTFSYFPYQYQNWFIKECFRACNEFYLSIGYYKKLTLLEQQTLNEQAKLRIVGLTLETRPDYIHEKEIHQMRKLGATRVELGVQSIYNNILELNQRGHDIATTIQATKLLKEAGFKINYHMMTELPGSSPTKDIAMFKTLFSDDNFQPDMLKIYPCVVVQNAPLYQWLKTGKYTTYTEKQRIKSLVEIKKLIPRYVRITRLIRDIPSTSIIAGNKITNLRQTLYNISQQEGWNCQCIRCREIKSKKPIAINHLQLFREDYEASNGREIFLTFEDKQRKHLYSLLRLRINYNYTNSTKKHFLPELTNAAIIREIHTYGKLTPLQTQHHNSPQHLGLGKMLLSEAEKITSLEFKLNKIAIISGVGVREYYRRQGYQLDGTYMIKII